MELATSAGAEPRARRQYETAGENLQNVSVLMMRPRGNVFNVHIPEGGMRALMDRTLK